MSDTPTPETDAAVNDAAFENKNHPHTDWVVASFARQLERERDEARQCFEIAKGNTEAALNSFHAEQKQRRQLERELEVLRKRVSEYQPYADNALTAASKVIEWQQCEQERDQLRKVADELAYCSGCGCGVDFGLCNRCSTASNSYNQLPHVIERNAK